MDERERFHGEARHHRCRPRPHAAPYEDGSFEPEPDGKVFSGSHLDAVGTRRVTVVYDAKDTQRVAMIARSKGVKPSSVYRDALDYYLAAQA